MSGMCEMLREERNDTLPKCQVVIILEGIMKNKDTTRSNMTYKLTPKYKLKRVAQFQRNGISLLFPLQRDFFPRVRNLTSSVE